LRRAKSIPGDDPISTFLSTRRDGEPLGHEEVVGLSRVCWAEVSTRWRAAMSFSACFLAGRPAHRRQLIDQPELIPYAVEELLRRYGIANNGASRQEDFEYKGMFFHAAK